ncbi:MAG: biotin--[acetyl-CoA-carboxylase] ligase [Oceanococcus sp.]
MTIDQTSLELIRCLTEAEWISGTQLAHHLGVSREAVSKRMRKLDELQLVVEKQAGRGYRLQQTVELLKHSELAKALDAWLAADCLTVLSSTASTNRWLTEHPEIRLCFAEHQSEGRGRRGRVWHSPFGQNLYLSLKVDLINWPDKLPALGLALGVALCQRFAEELNIPLQLKWPNDLYLNSRKCGGMLIEQRGEAQGPCQLIIGLGMNALMNEADIDQQWTSLSREGYPVSRHDAAICASKCLLEETQNLSNDRLEQRLASFSKFDVFRDQQVCILGASDSIEGRSLGIDEWGRLRLQTTAGMKSFSVGDVSLRPKK